MKVSQLPNLQTVKSSIDINVLISEVQAETVDKGTSKIIGCSVVVIHAVFVLCGMESSCETVMEHVCWWDTCPFGYSGKKLGQLSLLRLIYRHYTVGTTDKRYT